VDGEASLRHRPSIVGWCGQVRDAAPGLFSKMEGAACGCDALMMLGGGPEAAANLEFNGSLRYS